MTLEEIEKVECKPGSEEKFCPELNQVYKNFVELLKLAKKNSLLTRKQICRSFQPLSKNFKFCKSLKRNHLKRVQKRILGLNNPRDISSALVSHCLENPKSLICEKIFILGKILGDTKFSTLAGCPMGQCEFNHWKRWNKICGSIAREMKYQARNIRWNPDKDLENRTDYWKCGDEVNHMRKLEKIYEGEYIYGVREHHQRHPMSNGEVVYWTFDTVKVGDGSRDDWADVVPIASKVLMRMRKNVGLDFGEYGPTKNVRNSLRKKKKGPNMNKWVANFFEENFEGDEIAVDKEKDYDMDESFEDGEKSGLQRAADFDKQLRGGEFYSDEVA